MDNEQEVRREVERAAADEQLSKLAERIGASASARAAFGEPVERDGVTVIPVAKVRYGFGAGSGPAGSRRRGAGHDGADGEGQLGSGGGGGVQAAPFGYIELRDGHAHFKRITHPARMVAAVAVPLAVAGVGAAVWLGRSRAH